MIETMSSRVKFPFNIAKGEAHARSNGERVVKWEVKCDWNVKFVKEILKREKERVSLIVQITVTNRRAMQRKSSPSPHGRGERREGRRVGRLTVGLWDGIENHRRQTRAAINLSLAQTSIRLCIQEYVMSRGCPPKLFVQTFVQLF